MPDAANAARELFHDDYIVVRMDADGLLVWLIRSAVPYPDIPALVQSFEGVLNTLDALDSPGRSGRPGRAMLFDTRAARGRNDPEFERAMAAVRPLLESHFVRVGVLVASAVGALQMRRWVSADGIERLTGTNAAELASTLRAELASKANEE